VAEPSVALIPSGIDCGLKYIRVAPKSPTVSKLTSYIPVPPEADIVVVHGNTQLGHVCGCTR